VKNQWYSRIVIGENRMGIYQARDNRKPSGGYRRRGYKVKRKALHGRFFTETKVGEKDIVVKERVRGGNIKNKLKTVGHAVVTDPQTSVSKKEKILRVIETPANKEYARRGIIVKGTIIEVESGKAVVTSRPGQHGIVNAVLLKE
jgi:small subunit ribosomal protein S8e